ncbi:zf-HC2 domain-containing protein [Corallococcus sp. H22C18031201]|uniref:zf-HC2 domain-containing protein n=1 Tax=Citreicoccus inhibens TaxID=2849499 RepID=UPI000E71BF4F|nr:zf-HC2 domain-containing protein [Citreicoccus inhibens]MBU8896643.1 zf-HC2 domain-containing protein [Citreicoccus inhibens]RJS14761.1 zf-HC2 domain-containing protein [Corallococcus sp. H22C18031201]
MNAPCPEHPLEALLAGELPFDEAERVQHHVDSCAACTQSMAWLKLERGWMAQRARRAPHRRALDFSALEARLASAQALRARTQGRWSHQGKMALGAIAALLFIVFNVTQQLPPTPAEDAWGLEAWSVPAGETCVDPTREAVAAIEARVGACLVATPVVLSIAR